MRINEDFLDNIERDIVSDHISVQDMNVDDSAAWTYIFNLESSEIAKKRKVSFYIQKIERLHHLLIAVLEKCPVITGFNHNFVIQIGFPRDNEYNEMMTDHGVTIRWPRQQNKPYESIEEYFDPKSARSTAISIQLGLNAKTDTMLQIRRLMLSLWKAYSTAFCIVYRSAGYPNSVYMRNQNFIIICSGNHKGIWESKNEREHKFFTEAYRVFHPEMKPAQIKPIIDEFTGQDSSLQKVLKNFCQDDEWKKKTGKQPRHLKNLVNCAKKVELMNDGRLNFHWFRNEYYLDDYMLISPKTRNKEYIITDITDIKYMISVGWEGTEAGYLKDKCQLIMQYCKDIATEVKNIIININGQALQEFIDGDVDFRKFLPGMNVKVEISNEELWIWQWDMKHSRNYINQYPNDFNVTITDSYGTKTYHFKKYFR